MRVLDTLQPEYRQLEAAMWVVRTETWSSDKETGIRITKPSCQPLKLKAVWLPKTFRLPTEVLCVLMLNSFP